MRAFIRDLFEPRNSAILFAMLWGAIVMAVSALIPILFNAYFWQPSRFLEHALTQARLTAQLGELEEEYLDLIMDAPHDGVCEQAWASVYECQSTADYYREQQHNLLRELRECCPLEGPDDRCAP